MSFASLPPQQHKSFLNARLMILHEGRITAAAATEFHAAAVQQRLSSFRAH
jgi:hypothetical protein